MNRLGFKNINGSKSEISYLSDAYSFYLKKNKLADFGYVNSNILKRFGIKNEVLFAEIDWNIIIKNLNKNLNILKLINFQEQEEI